MTGIYIIENTNNQQCYVGSAVNINNRWRRHKSLLNRSKHNNKKLQNSWNKYGSDSFKFNIIIESTINKLIENEQYYIDKIKPEFNHRKIASSNLGMKYSDITRKRMSDAQKLSYKENPERGKAVSNFNKGNTYNLGRASKRKGITVDKESIDLMRTSKSTKYILQYDLDGNLIKEWSNMAEIIDTGKYSNGNILRCCKNKRKTHKGFMWKFKKQI